MHESRPLPTPMTNITQLSAHNEVPFSDPHLYRSVVGALQYATFTRLDIAWAVNKICQYMHAPLDTHWKAAKRILRYLKGTSSAGVTLFRESDGNVVGFSDADWASSLDDRWSTSSFCIFLGKNLISWSAKKQSTASRSSTEAEYRNVASATAEIKWIQSLLQKLHIASTRPLMLWCDNLSTIALASNAVFHSRSKHIELDLHFVREKLIQKALTIGHVPTAEQPVDILTKPLPQSRFLLLKDKLMPSISDINLRGDKR